MATSIRRPKQHEEMMKQLCQEKNRIFATYKDAMVFAACLGFQQGRRVSFEKTAEPISREIFRGKFDEAVFQCIGLVETNDPTIMGISGEEERTRLFEEYACGGLDILNAEVFCAAGSWDQLLLNLVVKEAKAKESVLDDITNSFLQN